MWAWVMEDGRWKQADNIWCVILWLWLFVEQKCCVSQFQPPPRSKNTSWWKGARAVSHLTAEQGVWEVLDPPSPPCSDVTVTVVTRHVVQNRRQEWGGCLHPYHIPSDHPLLQMPPPFSPTVLSPSHRLVPFPSEPTAICASRNTPRLFFSGSRHSTSLCSDSQDAAAGFLKLFHVRDPQISQH